MIETYLNHTLNSLIDTFVPLSRALRRRLLSERSEEEARLSEESDRALKELRESAQAERERQQHRLRSHMHMNTIRKGAPKQWSSV